MPTKIALRKVEGPPPAQSPPNNGFSARKSIFASDAAGAGGNSSMYTPRRTDRQVLSMRTSIMRTPTSRPLSSTELNGRGYTSSALSKTDIRASPRLTGYVAQLLTAAVCLVSAIQFFRAEEDLEWPTLWDVEFTSENDKLLHQTSRGPVFRWKLTGCMIVGLVGTSLTLLIVLAHFDTYVLPETWFRLFRDGSKAEQVLLGIIVIFWALGLYVNTSVLSVGELQGNIYFTTWVAFLSSVLNFGVWRISAGKPSLAEEIIYHGRMTTYNWVWTLICVTITAGAVTDVYFNQDYVTIRLKGEVVVNSNVRWITVLSVAWGSVFLAALSIVLNTRTPKSIKINFRGGKRLVIEWRHFEGIFALAFVGYVRWNKEDSFV